MNRNEKELKLSELQEKFARVQSAVLIDFTGISVNNVTALRNQLRDKGVEYQVVKNTLAKKAMVGTNMALLEDAFKGTTGVALSYDDPSAPAKVLTKAKKDIPAIVFKAAMVDGKRFGADRIEDLSKLPSKDEVRAQLLATLMAPAQQLVGVLQAPLRDFALVLKAREEQQKGESA